MFASLQNWVVLALSVFAFGLEVFALVDCVTRKAGAFAAAGKLTKQIWLIILAVAAALGFIALPSPIGTSFGALSPLGLLAVIAVVAAAVYLTDVRPAVRGYTGRGGGRSGPYGPW
ncbi:MAG TPA: DUF2516 family protein [Kineosporiaceae bacterium]|nr:DUF2516 family protein [Kineosporiaceae bacterium]